MFHSLRSTIKPGEVIDVHVHIAGPEGENNELYYTSELFKKSLSYEGIKLVTKLTSAQITGPRYVSVLLSQLKQSRHVDKIVLLALDQAYSEEGQVLTEATHLYVSNEYLAYLSQMYPMFLFGCSVHPYRQDAVDALWECAAHGAVLCKWLPSSQSIDPTHPLSQKFYRALAELKMPLLIHMGPEETIPGGLSEKDELLFNAAGGKYGTNPGDAITMALDAGATVIIAHSATPLGKLLDKHNDYWEKVFAKLLGRVEKGNPRSSLYADISAFCLPGRFKYVKQIIPLAHEMPERFLYGSDYPIPIVSFKNKSIEEVLDAFGWLAGRALPTNDFDKNYQLLEPHFSKATFTAAAKVLRHPQMPLIPLDRYRKELGMKKRKKFWFLGRKNESI